MSPPPVCGPAFTVKGKPEEELNARWRRSFPDQRRPQRLRAAKKHRTVGGRRRVALAGRQVSGKGVWRLGRQINLFNCPA